MVNNSPRGDGDNGSSCDGDGKDGSYDGGGDDVVHENSGDDDSGGDSYDGGSDGAGSEYADDGADSEYGDDGAGSEYGDGSKYHHATFGDLGWACDSEGYTLENEKELLLQRRIFGRLN